MRACPRFVFVLLVTAALVTAADPALMKLVMPEARFVSGFNISQAMSSALGQFLVSQAQGESEEFQKFIATTGFDPRRDLREVVIASAAGPKPGQTGLVLVRGNFDPAKILDLAKQHGVVAQSYKGVPILTGGKDHKLPTGPNVEQNTEGWFAVLDNSVAVLGDAASVRGAIDRRGGTASGLNAKLAARVSELSGVYDFWGVSVIPATEFASAVPDEKVSGAMKGDVFRSVQEASGGIRFGNDIEITGEAVTRSEKDATALADVVRFLMGMVQMNQDPKTANLTKFLQGMELKTDSNVVRMSMRLPEAEIEKLILAAKAQHQQAASAGPMPRHAGRPSRKSGDIVIQGSPKDMGNVVIKQ